MNIAQTIDHTLLRPTATQKDIERLCNEAIENNLFAVCIYGSFISLCKQTLLSNANTVKICSVVGFPSGAVDSRTKLYEAQLALESGADELDMVINLGWVKSENWKKITQEIQSIKNIVGDKILKVIIETCYLDHNEKIKLTELVCDTGADFIKTSTGFGTAGADLKDVKLISKLIKNGTKIKASGGIADFKTAKKFIEAGASRIGTSKGLKIMEENNLLDDNL